MTLRIDLRNRAAPLAALLVTLLAAGPSCIPTARTLYVLAPGSTFLEGCIDGPCDCAVRFTEDVVGRFELEELPTLAPGTNRLFRVDALHVLVGRGDQVRWLRGEGLYQNDPVARTQRLGLTLAFDGGPPREFDSGVVPDAAGFPAIAVEVSEFGAGACFDTRLRLAAVPFDARCRSNDDCGEGSYCQKPTGRCDGAGVCTPRGEACPAVVDPVCGCDGKTYGNACEAGVAGVSVAAAGACAER